MKITITSILTFLPLLFLLPFSLCSRTNLTNFYANLLESKTISYQVHSGYEDIEQYLAPELASIYYSIWECSTKRFTDHSTPVVFYLSGGPGLTSQYAAFREFGPVEIVSKNGDYAAVENPWSWNYFAHLVFVDQPAGVGFSYNRAKTVDNSKTIALHFINFLTNFLKNFPYGLGSNPLYLAGEGYAAQYISVICEQLSTNKSSGIQIQGVILGGAMINPEKQINNYESFLSAAGIVSPKIRDLAHIWQNQAIIKLRNGKNRQARISIDRFWSTDTVNKLYNGINIYNYKTYSDNSEGRDYLGFLKKYKTQFGVPDNVNFVELNYDINSAMSEDMYRSYMSSFENLVSSDKRVLIYNGQNDLLTPTAGIVTVLQDLQWKGARDWRQTKKLIWKQSGKIAGWIKKYKNLIFVILKGTGHYIYQDDASSDRATYLMINNYFTKKW